MKLNEYTNKIILLLSSIFVTLLIFEVTLRIADYSYTPLKIKVKGTVHDWRFHHSFEDKHFVYDPKLIWRPKKNYSIFNSQGFRGKEHSKVKKANELRIFAIGDSNTLGWGKKDGPNWPMYLEELLTKTGKICRVINAGAWGYSVFQGVERFKETLSFQPDMVLISFGANDAHLVHTSDADFLNLRMCKFPLYKLKIGQLIIATWDKVVDKELNTNDENLVHRVSLQEYKEHLIEIINISKENNIICILLTRPFIGKSHNKLWWKNFAPDYVAATIETGESKGVPVIDIYSHFKGKNDYFIDESHFNEEGHKLASRILYQEIKFLLQ
ncbi:MAG: SGNH/GDSL hydrolase family protein [Candidatus Scalinduaceae bacterium]